MGAVAWGALGSAVVLALVAVRLVVWRRALGRPPVVRPAPVLDLPAEEAALRAEALAFDRIVGHLLLTDPGFADSADRLARQDDTGPAS